MQVYNNKNIGNIRLELGFGFGLGLGFGFGFYENLIAFLFLPYIEAGDAAKMKTF